MPTITEHIEERHPSDADDELLGVVQQFGRHGHTFDWLDRRHAATDCPTRQPGHFLTVYVADNGVVTCACGKCCMTPLGAKVLRATVSFVLAAQELWTDHGLLVEELLDALGGGRLLDPPSESVERGLWAFVAPCPLDGDHELGVGHTDGSFLHITCATCDAVPERRAALRAKVEGIVRGLPRPVGPWIRQAPESPIYAVRRLTDGTLRGVMFDCDGTPLGVRLEEEAA